MSRPFIPAPNTTQVEVIYQAGPYFMENALHTFKGSPFSLADLQAQRAVFVTWLTNTWMPQQSNAVSCVRVKSKALDSTASPLDDYVLPSAIVGSIAGAPLTLGVTFAIKLTSDTAGRSARGRLYTPGFPANRVIDSYGNTNTATASAYVTALNTLRTALASAGYTLCVTSYRTGKAWRSTAENFAVTNVTYTDLHLDIQRRRMPGRGQ